MINNIIIWKVKLLNSAVAGSRKLCKHKTYFNHNYMNGLFLIVYTMALMFPSHISTLETESNKIRCSDSMTCTKCTIKPMCAWSLKQQACENKNTFASSSLISSRIGECPQYSVVTKYEYSNITHIYVDIFLKITNDLVGFVNYINSNTMYYQVQNSFTEPVNRINETNINYSFVFRRKFLNVNTPSLTLFVFLKFNDVMLRFDNVADNYVTVYEHEECVTDDKYKSCATCGWNIDGYSNYLRWCPSENTCKVSKNLYMKNSATNELHEKVAYVTNDCAEINVTAVDPLSGPKTGGTTVTIIVRNHRIFMENRSLKVMVAGTLCMNPKTSGIETITCTTSQPSGTPSGPVLVEYSSIEGVLKIESSQRFQFCFNPVLDANQTLVGVMSGGTSVLVRGGHFVEPCIVSSVRLYVDLPDGVRWYADSYCDTPINDTYMVCRSPRMNCAHWDGNMKVVGRLFNFGLMKFTENQPLHINGTLLSFYVNPDPVLEKFIIDENGSIVINGLNLEHLRLDDIVVRFLNSSDTDCVVISIKLELIICNPTTAINPDKLHEILVNIGDSLSYTLANRSPTPIVGPSNLLVSEYPSILLYSNETSCSDSMTCTKCTIKPMCIWSLQQQACENRTQFNSSGFIVVRIEKCPRFSVVKEFNYDKSTVSLKYIVKLSNDMVGVRNYFNDIVLYNRFPTYCKYPTRQVNTYNETIISCDFFVKKLYFDHNNPSYTFFTFIKFNDVILRFDNVADHYVTFYGHEECANDEKYNSCATCAWNNDGYSHYLIWCSSNHTCQVNKNVYMKNNGYEQLSLKLTHLTNNCAEINVTAVNPLSGPETGGTTLTITVRNHRILADNRTVMVTVAGTVCVNPRTLGPETITCTTSQYNETLSGPILVEYTSIENVLKIESSQIFQFCLNPVLDTNQQLEGIASGGTSVQVHGGHFVESCFPFFARLYVDLADGVRRYADSYCDPPVNETYLVCRSPSVNGASWDGDASVAGRFLNFGLDITFSNDDFSVNQTLPIVVSGPLLRYYVQPDPVLLDFEIDTSGSLVVNGLHLQHVQPKDIMIRSVDSSSSVCVVVSVTQHSLKCEPTMNVTEISVTLGNSLVFTGIKKTLSLHEDPSKLPSWFLAIIAMFTVLVFVCALTCCLRMKYRNTATENIHNPSVAFTRSQDLDKHTAL
ncbi:uncharacterized protein LOC111034179 [Myzus persicae]|uniref:uncharacterized protein LOC111034179 n=1 Tax=Myzus persicae TaxID=13164 RepID=UPI000B9356AD|nr:uncharacterized protein LOC111034179 [Myzus persicae]